MQQNRRRRRSRRATARSSGLLAGLVGAFVWLIVSISISLLIGRSSGGWSSASLRNARDVPPEVREMLESHGASGRRSACVVFGFVLMLVCRLDLRDARRRCSAPRSSAKTCRRALGGPSDRRRPAVSRLS